MLYTRIVLSDSMLTESVDNSIISVPVSPAAVSSGGIGDYQGPGGRDGRQIWFIFGDSVRTVARDSQPA